MDADFRITNSKSARLIKEVANDNQDLHFIVHFHFQYSLIYLQTLLIILCK